MKTQTKILSQFQSTKSTAMGSRCPVCLQCKTEMIPEKNSVLVCQHDSTNKPAKIWYADLWKCPICKHEIILGFGLQAVSEFYEENFEDWLRGVEYHF